MKRWKLPCKSREAVVKVIDFGLAKLGGLPKITKTHTTMGTVAYMSPEQARGEEVDQRTDVWSLGVVVYEMLSGQLPFPGAHAEAIIHSILAGKPKPLKQLRPEVTWPRIPSWAARLHLSCCRQHLPKTRTE